MFRGVELGSSFRVYGSICLSVEDSTLCVSDVKYFGALVY